MEQFKDKVAIVTGGGSGIGQALCQELGQRGSMVVVASLHDDHAKRVASAIMQNGGQAHAVQVDVSNEEDVRRLIDGTVSKYGRLTTFSTTQVFLSAAMPATSPWSSGVASSR
jgi:NAD(P)-dependent dehydrogenase (short-subunit alcohol dehydrogenase family)